MPRSCYCESEVFRTAKSRKPKRSRTLSITLVTADGRMLAELSRYLQTAGVFVRPVPILGGTLQVPRYDDAIVVFADEFASREMLALVGALSADDRSPLLVLVTSNLARYAELGVAEPRKRVVILPRPAWGWSIVDAVRACVERPMNLRSAS